MGKDYDPNAPKDKGGKQTSLDESPEIKGGKETPLDESPEINQN